MSQFSNWRRMSFYFVRPSTLLINQESRIVLSSLKLIRVEIVPKRATIVWFLFIFSVVASRLSVADIEMNT